MKKFKINWCQTESETLENKGEEKYYETWYRNISGIFI